MNKTAIKNFAIWARRKLIDDISYKAGLLGVTEKSIAEPLPESTRDMQVFDIGTKEPVKVMGVAMEQRAMLVAAIRGKMRDGDLKSAFQYVMEEVAYTWFNRLIAIRFMEVNDYLPSRTRVLSSENPAKVEPDFVTNPFDTDLSFTDAQQETVMRLKDTNKPDELFRMLFIMQCNKLHEILPRLFEPVSDYTELLLTISFTDKDGIIYHLTHDIEEKDFNVDVEKGGQVEIIGWLYQYYNTEPKDKVFEGLKKNIKITKDTIPAATQLFTPDWIVKYMVENSLGRLWAEGHEDFDKSQWHYYLEEAEQEPEVARKLQELREERKNLHPEEIKCIDPCMGSGHILVRMFDVLMRIYTSQGYGERDAASLIVQNNLYGLDIDDRAGQLAYFAVMMKARQYDRRFFGRSVQPHVHAVPETVGKLPPCSHEFGMGQQLYSAFHDGKEYGSLLDVGMGEAELNLLKVQMDDMLVSGDLTDTAAANAVMTLWDVAMTLVQKYDAVVTNPPYMGSSNMGNKLNQFVKDYYPDSKSDLFAVFIEKCGEMAKVNGYQAMITQHAWMFLSSFEKLRLKLLQKDTVNMAHLGARAFEEIGGEVVQTTSFVLRKNHTADYQGVYCRLIEPTTQQGKEDAFLAGENRHTAKQSNFSKIPASPVAYWISDKLRNSFTNRCLSEIGQSYQGIITGDVNIFLRLWHEASYTKIIFNEYDYHQLECSNCYYPYIKGGVYRKWYGNNEYVIRWLNNGNGLVRSRTENRPLFFKSGITWSLITTAALSFRWFPDGFLCDVSGSSYYSNNNFAQKTILAFLNSKVSCSIMNVINPTINLNIKDIMLMPIANADQNIINPIVRSNIQLSKYDWDSFETSWDFKCHPLVRIAFSAVHWNQDFTTVEECFKHWSDMCEERFTQLKANEEELNRIFIDIYGLQDELTPEVEDKDVTVRKADLQRDIKSLISYAVGCVFGRYSLDVEGLAYAGGEWDASKYMSFIPDADNCIPITDEEYFDDDIVSRFVNFIKTVYGKETLEQNLDFIAKSLGNKGNTSRDIIRNYFLTDFFKDHTKVYQKRPIYWLFDSGKQNGFKALVYMHRWNADTVGNMRVEYLHRMQRVYESEIERMQEAIENSHNSKEITNAQKRKDKLTRQLKETKEYDAGVAHIALRRIDIDLDDGVKVNYDKVQTDLDGKNLGILSTIK